MAKHHPDLIFCRKQAGVAIGRYNCENFLVQLMFSIMNPENIKLRFCDNLVVLTIKNFSKAIYQYQ